MDREYFMGRKILVTGLGRSGAAALKTLLAMGADVSVQDSKMEKDIDSDVLQLIHESGVKAYLGCVPDEKYDMVVLSPGVPPALPFIKQQEAAGAEITGELELAYRICRGKFAAITGTNGKTTTTTLAGRIFGAAFEHSYVGGNIGVPVVSEAYEAPSDAWLVTECSSFQLETTSEFHPSVSAVLNLTPDHLNRHGSMENYGKAKAKIFANQTEDEYVVINYDDKNCLELAQGCRAKLVPFSRKEKLSFGAYVDDGMIVVNDGSIHEICDVSELKIIGAHNIENVLAAAALSYFAGIDTGIISEEIRNFRGVEHRIEFAGQKNGIRFYNDSKGTNTDATITAIRALEKNIILLAGGDAKKQDFEPLAAELDGAVRYLVLYGRDAESIRRACDDAGFTSYCVKSDLEEALKEAVSKALPGDSILLSPACASWDAYPDFEARGNHFKEMVMKYIEN